jgi:DICT domain-containing protein
MSLTELIAGVETHRKTLTVFNPEAGVLDELSDRFADRNVVVRAEETDHGPSNYVVLGEDDDFLTAAGVQSLLADERTEPAFDASSYESVLDHLDETMFTSFSKERMLAASREIEDRAWRIGSGELHSGFQTVSVLSGELDVYERLGERDDLTVHAYAYPDTAIPAHDNVTLHPERTEEIEQSWFVAYDGGGVAENKCALLAEERADGFYGFWTYGADTVDYLIDHLTATYVRTEADGGVEDTAVPVVGEDTTADPDGADDATERVPDADDEGSDAGDHPFEWRF